MPSKPTRPARPADYPAHTTEKLRYGDTDRQGHVNNAVFSTLFESGRVHLFQHPDRSPAPEGTEFVIVRLVVDFLEEMTWPGEVDVATGVAQIGRSSFHLVQALFVDGRCVARADNIMVLMDSQTRRSTPLPDDLRSALEALAAATVLP